MSADAQRARIVKALNLTPLVPLVNDAWLALSEMCQRQQRQDEEIERLRGQMALLKEEGDVFLRNLRASQARVQQLEDALREAADRFAAIAQGKTADMHEAVAARAEQAARAALDETEVLNDRI